MKKWVAVLTAAVMAASMAVPVMAEGSLADKKIAQILPGTIDDQGWNATNNAGAQAAMEELGITIDVIEAVPAEEYEQTFTEYASKGYDLVMAAGSQFDEACTMVAPEFPDTLFTVINGQVADYENQVPIFPKEYEGSYLAGIIAGYTTQNGQFAVLGGQSNDPMVKLMDTYEGVAIEIAGQRGIEGAAATRSFVDSWTDVAATKDMTSSMIDNGCDTVFCYSNEGTSGAIQAADEKGVSFVGFSADKNSESTCVVGSIPMDWAAVYPTIIQKVLDGTYTGMVEIGVAEGVYFLAETDAMTEECITAVNDAIEKIKNGEIDFTQYFGE